MNNPRRCFILRGVSGSGKSTLAKTLVAVEGIVHSTDSYFVDENGRYCFDPTRRREFHARNLEAFTQSARLGVSPLVLDNTNTQGWEYEPYLKVARDNGYEIEIISLPHPDPSVAAQRNIHGVPQEAIERMIARFEPDLVA